MATRIPPAANLRASLDHDGFVLIPNAITDKNLENLKHAANNATTLARSGNWPYLRTLPKQFPPWNHQDHSQGIWGVQHLLHPSMPGRNVFADSYFNATILEAITGLLQCRTDDLVLELYNMLIRPDRNFALRWHRDDIGPDVDSDEELRRLKEPMLHAQWNLALYPDTSLIVVPGSHKRTRTNIERNAHPYEDDMPNQRIIKLAPGDILFYNNNILHRGVYDSTQERMTLHGSMGIKGTERARARNILQHGIGSWAGEATFEDLEDPGMVEVAEGMRGRLLEMGRGEDVGYSQVN